jgi:hypothetical protein
MQYYTEINKIYNNRYNLEPLNRLNPKRKDGEKYVWKEERKTNQSAAL